MTGFLVNPVNYGTTVGALSLLQDQSLAAKYVYGTELYQQSASIFGQQANGSYNLGDSSSIYQYMYTSMNNKVSQAKMNVLNKINELFGNKTGASAATETRDPEEVADERQEEVEKFLKSNLTQVTFRQLTEDLESGDKGKIKAALTTLKKLGSSKKETDKIELAAFQKYLENEGKNFGDILTQAEQVDGIKEETINTIREQAAETRDWLSAYDVEEAQYINEYGADKDEIADMRQNRVEVILETDKTKEQFEKLTKKLDDALTSNDKSEINSALKSLDVLSVHEFAAFKQYLQDQGKDLDNILTQAEQADVKEETIRTIAKKDGAAQDWLEAIDIDED